MFIELMAIAGVTFSAMFALVIIDWSYKLQRLHKNGSLITKKGKYTFEKHGVNNNEQS